MDQTKGLIWFWVFTVLLTTLCQLSGSSFVTTDGGDLQATERECQGTSYGLSKPTTENHYNDLQQRYTNCSVVNGSLELTWLRGHDLDLSFLNDIKEVTGYVLISHIEVPEVRFPSLISIWGSSLLPAPKDAVRRSFGFLATDSTVTGIEMPELREIVRGSVGVYNSTGLCHWQTLNFTGMLSGTEAVVIDSRTSSENNCSCHPECTNGCWGSGRDKCQKYRIKRCPSRCHGFPCYGNSTDKCCHPFCAVGCTGPTTTDCLACRFFDNKGECVLQCPSLRRYNTSTASWDADPTGKFAFAEYCVDDCPAPLLKEDGTCVKECSSDRIEEEGTCIPCAGQCPKACPGVDFIHAGNVKTFEGCTIIQGSLTLSNESFSWRGEVSPITEFTEGSETMDISQLDVLLSVKEVTGYLDVRAADPRLTNLRFLRNLEVIGGEELTDYSSSILISGTHLRSLGLSLTAVRSGDIRISGNPSLCYLQDVQWDNITGARGNGRTEVFNNADEERCVAEDSICHDACSEEGCWGPGEDQCVSCKTFELDGRCVHSCNISRVFQVTSDTCDYCHEECEDQCFGPGSDQCEYCKNVEKNFHCLPGCSPNEFHVNGTCFPCHESCIYGCSGPKDAIGEEGCTKCAKYAIDGNLKVAHCLPHGFHCSEGYLFDWVVLEDTGYVSQGSRCYLHCDLKFPLSNEDNFDCNQPCSEGAEALRAVPACILDKREAAENLAEKVERQLNKAERFRAYNAYISTARAYARGVAEKLQRLEDRSEMPLFGMTIAMKDNIDVAHMPHTAGHKMLSSFIPTEDAPITTRLKSAGAIILGKVNMHELAYGVTSNNYAFGPVRNAFNASKFAGGSSGGTATAVALGLGDAGIGSDTGGSSRIPAAVSGIVGFRPSTGRYPSQGMTMLSRTRDTAGPMARDVHTIALLDDVLSGGPVTELVAFLPQDIRLGVPRAYFYENLSPDVQSRMEEVLERLSSAGVVLVEAEMLDVPKLTEMTGFPILYHECPVAFHEALNRTGLPVSMEEFVAGISSPDVKLQVEPLFSDPVPEEVYQQALNHYRPLLQKAFQTYFEANDLDAYIIPALPLPAQDIVGSEKSVMLNGKEVWPVFAFIRNMDPSSNAGVPSLTIPMGVNDEGMPMGFQIEGPAFSDKKLLAIGAAIERIMNAKDEV